MSVVVETVEKRDAVLVTFTGDIQLSDDLRDMHAVADYIRQQPRRRETHYIISLQFAPDVDYSQLVSIMRAAGDIRKELKDEYNVRELLVVADDLQAREAQAAVRDNGFAVMIFTKLEDAYTHIDEALRGTRR